MCGYVLVLYFYSNKVAVSQSGSWEPYRFIILQFWRLGAWYDLTGLTQVLAELCSSLEATKENLLPWFFWRPPACLSSWPPSSIKAKMLHFSGNSSIITTLFLTTAKKSSLLLRMYMDGITHALDMNLSKFQEMVRDREVLSATIHGVAKIWT